MNMKYWVRSSTGLLPRQIKTGEARNPCPKNPQPVNKLGGELALTAMDGDEKNGQTTIRFHISKVAIDQYPYNLEAGKAFWFICADSREDDFGHHSMMRQHVKVKL